MKRKKILALCILLGIVPAVPASNIMYANNSGPETAISKDLSHHESLNAVTSNTKKYTITTTVHSTEDSIMPSVTVSSVPPKASDRNSSNAYQLTNFPTSDATTISGQNTKFVPETPIITEAITQFGNVQSNAATSPATKIIEKISYNGNSTPLYETDESEVVPVEIAPKEHVDSDIEKSIQDKNVSISSEKNTSISENFSKNNGQQKNTNDKDSAYKPGNFNITVNLPIQPQNTESTATSETETTTTSETTTTFSSTTVESATTTETTATVESSTTTEATTPVEPAIPTELQEKDAILLPTKKGPIIVPVKIAPATQECVDEFDVVQDNELFSSDENILLFGHDYKSFSCLCKIEEGDKIVLWNDHIPKTYTIETNACGNLNRYGTDILDENGNTLLYNNMGGKTLRLITCEADLFLRYNRRVVVAVAN